MRIVMLLALAALIALVIAVLTGSAWPALAVVVLAASGIVLLVRDWRAAQHSADAVPALASPDLPPGEFSPDITDGPDGPSSDARADQI